MQRDLFGTSDLPDGFHYEERFLDTTAERALIERISSLDFHEVRMRGVAARRRVVQYGWTYSFESARLAQGASLPDFLLPLRDRSATLAGVVPDDLSEALITEYSPGATIGWHRDAPGFGTIAGISLLSPCRFRFRRGRTGSWETAELRLEPRSAYVLTGPARSEWQHSIPAVKELRYSITFRTVRRKKPPLVTGVRPRQ